MLALAIISTFIVSVLILSMFGAILTDGSDGHIGLAFIFLLGFVIVAIWVLYARWWLIAAEKSFENKIKDYLKQKGCYVIKTHGDRFSKVGTPDLLICCNGHFIGAEIKAENGVPSELQLYHLRQITNSGGVGLLLIPSKGIEKVRNYILKNYPQYADTKIYDFEGFKELIGRLNYENKTTSTR